MLRDLDAATGRLLPQSLQVPDYLRDLDPLDMSLFEGDLGAQRASTCPLARAHMTLEGPCAKSFARIRHWPLLLACMPCLTRVSCLCVL